MKTSSLPLMRRLLLVITAALAAVCAIAHASEVQIKTANGDTITGEFLGTQDGVIRVRSKYGEVSIPSKDVITMVKAPDGAAAADKNKKADPSAIEAPAVKFSEPKDVNLATLLASRAPDPAEPNKQERQEIFRYIRNFRDSSDKSRAKAIDILRSYGDTAYPFISAEYTAVGDLQDKIELLAAIAVPDSPYTAGIFAKTHATALAEFKRIAAAPPAAPPDYLTKKDRQVPSGPAGDVKAAAQRVLTIEADASIAQGPFNTLFLFQVYKARYSGETDVLLRDPHRDALLLSAAAADAGNAKSVWQGSDRVMLAEAALPLLFQDSDDLKALAQELLKRVLPSNHPKFAASEEEWFNWWAKNKDKIEKK